jgi:uncharacterized integral membrane protein
MFRNLMIGLVVLLVLAVAIIFTVLNPETVQLDLAFSSFQTPISLAMSASFVMGWLFGLLCMLIYVLGLLRERRALRKSLRLADTEVANLRGLPMQDAS